MKTFLQCVAEDIYNKYADRLSDIVVVFPNNRARLFFNRALADLAGKPVWTPRYESIADVFTHASQPTPSQLTHEDATHKGAVGPRLAIADPLKLCGWLYQCYQEVFGHEESFDLFYGWGNILLNDFDNIDKNCADARQLFRNISEQGEYDDNFAHLSPAQREALERFFGHLDLPAQNTSQPTCEDATHEPGISLGRNEMPKSEIKRRFIRLWNGMYRLYSLFRERLEAEGEAYEGMIFRRCVEDEFRPENFPAERYLFVGFNALNVCETKLFEKLKNAGKARFYWDYDNFYLLNPRHEAGLFLRENLEKFPNELDRPLFDNFATTPKQIRMISSPTETAQAHYAGRWLQESGYDPTETAVVLCNEGLLLPMLHCIPENVPDLNVTMGYPLSQTPVYNSLRNILLLHSDGCRDGRFRAKFILPVLRDPYLNRLSPLTDSLRADLIDHNLFAASREELSRDEGLSLLFGDASTPMALGKLLLEIIRRLTALTMANAGSDTDDETEESSTDAQTLRTPAFETAPAALPGAEAEIFLPLYEESLFQCFTAISRLNDLLREGLFEMTLVTYRRLLLKMLSVAIPFSGEPLRGIQLMGLLETRNLDFRNVLILSLNEGTVPKKTPDSSFIPYNLRRAFSLTGQEHRDAISAYYFFRLIQRAENVTCVYNSSTDGLNSGEMSRFLLQLQVEGRFPIAKSALAAPVSPDRSEDIHTEKTPEVLARIPNRLSPSAINCYLDCPLKFCFKYVKRLAPVDEITEEIDGAVFGTMFHAAAQHLYTRLMLEKSCKPFDIEDVEKFIAVRERARRKGTSYAVAGQACRVSASQRVDTPDFGDDAVRIKVTADDVKAMRQNRELIESIVFCQFQKEVFKSLGRKAVPLEAFNGEQIIDFKLICLFVERLLELDMAYAPFEILDLEHRIDPISPLTTSDGHTFTSGGVIDRIDRKDGVIRIVDYKTGGEPAHPSAMTQLFQPDDKRPGYILQTFLYASMAREAWQTNDAIKPVLLYIHLAFSKKHKENIEIAHQPVLDIRPYEEEFRSMLSQALAPLFDASVPFRPAPNRSCCRYCDFRRICGREE